MGAERTKILPRGARCRVSAELKIRGQTMFQIFYPDRAVSSAYKIPYEKLYQRGVRGLLYDIDNTLTEHGADATNETLALMNRLKKIGFRIMFLSNNDEERVVRFNQKIGAGYICKAGKPSKKSYLRAMQRMGTTKENTVFIGDQLFTDIWGAKRAGIYTYLVRPIAAHEEIQIVLKRKLERIVLFFYWRKKRREKREVNDQSRTKS